MGIEVCEALGEVTAGERSLWMYEVFYDFKAEPFRLSPDHKFCYEHKSYAKARAYMAYAFKRAEGFVMITGRPGTGKTTLIGELVESLSKDRVYTANLVCTQLQADDLLKTVGFSFGIGSTGVDKAEMLQRLTVLLHRWHREARRALLIVDEAQDLSSSAMEELRLLTNIQIGGQPLLQIFLLGQPELRDLILSPAMEQVHQRIVAASHIEGLGVEETEAYVLHRLTVVGWRGDPAIDRAIFPLIHKFSEGVPRRINLICSRLFLLGSVEQRHDIGVQDVRVVITELQAENLAAGTGISPQDFDQVGEPEWVPAPEVASHAPAAHRLHAVDNEPSVRVAEAAIEAKKKDNSGLTVVPHPIADDSSAEFSDSGVYYELEPEYDQNMEAPPANDYQSPRSDRHETLHEERDFEPPHRGPVSSTGAWRKPAALTIAAVAIVSLILLVVYFAKREMNFGVERGYLAGGPVEEGVAEADLDLTTHAANKPLSDREVTLLKSDEAPAVPLIEKLPESSPAILEISTADETPNSVAEVDLVGHVEPDPSKLSTDADANQPEADANISAVDSEITLSINFEFDSDDLVPDSHLALDEAVMLLRENPDSIAAITGFTDKQGKEEYNLQLSRKRADAVKQYLVDAGIESERLFVEGRGSLSDLGSEEAFSQQDSMEPYRVVQIKLSAQSKR